MSTPLLTLSRDSTLMDALHLFNTRHIHGAPVIDDEILGGIVTLSDVAKAVENGFPLNTPVNLVMTQEVVKVPADVQLFEVITRFKEKEIGRLIVEEKGHPVGILTQSDIIRVFPSL
jgi:hypothetical protein